MRQVYRIVKGLGSRAGVAVDVGIDVAVAVAVAVGVAVAVAVAVAVGISVAVASGVTAEVDVTTTTTAGEAVGVLDPAQAVNGTALMLANRAKRPRWFMVLVQCELISP